MNPGNGADSRSGWCRRRRRAPAFVAGLAAALCLADSIRPILAAQTQRNAEEVAEGEELRRRVEELERVIAELEETIRKLEAQSTPIPSPAPAPMTLVSSASGRNYLNLSLDALVAGGASTVPDVPTLEPGGHDPAQRGFTVQNVEAVFDGAVDPYFRGQANVILQITPDGETSVELEEAFATTSSLPCSLQVKVGQYLTEFGRLNPTHPHVWDFVNQPLPANRMFGPDGLRSVGARLSWLMPTPIYSELSLGVQNGHGETQTSFGSVPGEIVFGRPIEDRPVQSLDDLLYVPRYAASLDLSGTQTILFGASAALGPNGTGEDGQTTIYGADVFWKWKPPRASKGFPFVKVQAEWMARSYRASATPTLAAETFRDHGAYTQVVWGFRPMWTLGARYDTVAGDAGDDPLDPAHESRHRLSANLTWFPTEYSKIRLQYDLDERAVSSDAHSVWLQFEFLLGAHAAHKF